jgi:hypothetical protein
MDKEEKLESVANDLKNTEKNIKQKYFRIEKIRKSFSKENKNKAIFKTKKDYNLLKRKILRNKEKVIISTNNKLITKNADDTTASAQSDNSVLVQNIISKKLIINENKKELETNIIKFSKLKQNYIYKDNNLDNSLLETEKNKKNVDFNKIRIKLMLVYFCSIKNLCKYINNNFFNIQVNESKIIDECLYQIYQSLQILNRKIKEFKLFENIKDNVKINKEDFCEIDSLKDNLLLMKNTLNNVMSQNLNNIYISIENFCKVYSS